MNPSSRPMATRGPVRVIGTGLLGASLGLALRTRGVAVQLEDPSPTALAVAVHVGAGLPATPADAAPRLVVVAAPVDVCGDVVADALARFPAAVVTDVASVKGPVAARVAERVAERVADVGADLARYVGSHPMAGREYSGPAHAQADLFAGRPWVIAAGPGASEQAILTVRDLAVDLDAVVVSLTPQDHDRAVAAISHLPQLMATLTAARLVNVDPAALGLAGQGLRDVTRVAASSPALWSVILAANAPAVHEQLLAVRADLDALIAALDKADTGHTGEALVDLTEAVVRGNQGVGRIPGKHGGATRVYDVVTVLVPDEPGELGRLFAEVGAEGLNLEDLHLEHSPGQPVGLADLSVLPGLGEQLAAALVARGWRVVS